MNQGPIGKVLAAVVLLCMGLAAAGGEDIRRTRDLPRDAEFLVGMEPRVRNYQLRVNAIRP